MEILLRAGADPNQPLRINLYENTALCATPFSRAVLHLTPNIIDLLFLYGAKIDCTRYYKHNILDFAIDSRHNKAEKLRILLSRSDRSAIDDGLIKRVLNNQNYELMEVLFAFVKKYQIDIKTELIPQSLCKRWNILNAKLMMVAFPGWQNGNIKVRYNLTNFPNGSFSVRDYASACDNSELLELIDEGLPTLFNMITIHLRFIEINTII